MTRITVLLEPSERRALDDLARREMRDVRQQAAFIIRRELQRRGLLAPDDAADNPAADEVCHEQ